MCGDICDGDEGDIVDAGDNMGCVVKAVMGMRVISLMPVMTWVVVI